MAQFQVQLDKKQQYFRQNIGKNDYDAFSRFCQQQKGNLNIDQWSYEEAVLLVDKFNIFKQFDLTQNPLHNDSSFQNKSQQEKQNQPSQKQQGQNNNDQQNTNKNGTNEKGSFSALQLLDLMNLSIEQGPNQNNNKTTQKTNIEEQQINTEPSTKIIQIPKQIDVKQPTKTKPNQANGKNKSDIKTKNNKQQYPKLIKCKVQAIQNCQFTSVVIKKHEIVHRTFFLPDYVMYHLEVSPLNKICKRNYEDFTRLRAELTKMYPGVKIPYLQSNSWLSQTNIQFIKKQKICLQFFLNQLIKHPVLKRSEIFHKFLSLQDHKTMKRKFQDYQKIQSPKCLSQLTNSKGEIQLTQLSYKQNNQIQTLTEYSSKMKDFINQFSSASIKINQNYEIIISNVRHMTKLVQHMKNITLNLNNKLSNSSIQLIEFPKALVKLQAAFLYEYNSLNLQKYLQFLNYQERNIQEYDATLSIRRNLSNNLIDVMQKQSVSPSTIQNSQKNETSFYLKQLKQTEIMEPSDNILICQYHLKYANNMAIKQLKWMFQGLGQQLNERCSQNSKMYLHKNQTLEKTISNNLIY